MPLIPRHETVNFFLRALRNDDMMILNPCFERWFGVFPIKFTFRFNETFSIESEIFFIRIWIWFRLSLGRSICSLWSAIWISCSVFVLLQYFCPFFIIFHSSQRQSRYYFQPNDLAYLPLHISHMFTFFCFVPHSFRQFVLVAVNVLVFKSFTCSIWSKYSGKSRFGSA